MNNLKNRYDTFYGEEEINLKNLNLKRWPRNRYEGALKFIKITKNTHVLDVGCGGGVILNELVKKSDYVYGGELSKKRILILKNYFKDKIEFVEMNIEKKSKFKDNFFDVIILADVIEHVVDRYKAMLELERILKPGGILVLVTPNLAKARNRLKLIFGKYPSTGFDKNEGYGIDKNHLYDAGHLQYFTFNTLGLLAEKYDFKVVKSFGLGRFGKLHNFWPEFMSGEIGMILKK